MRIRTLVAPILILAAGLTACGGGDNGGGNPPVPGLLTVSLSSAPSNPGAIMFTVSGGQIDAVTTGSYPTYQTTLNSTSRRVLLTGAITTGSLVQIQVPDINKASSYTASIQQVAARGTDPAPYAQLPVAGFSIAVTQ
ncbi:MAG: hypothetical protein AB7I33_06105 [Gemmatimonadales bacterium]